MDKMKLDSMMHVLAYDDHADGNTYLAHETLVELPYVFTTALALLAQHDNVCITDPASYDEHTHDFYTIAPYSINMSLGLYAKPTEAENVAKAYTGKIRTYIARGSQKYEQNVNNS